MRRAYEGVVGTVNFRQPVTLDAPGLEAMRCRSSYWFLGSGSVAGPGEGVTGPIREAGHDVIPVSLTGMGDRAHLAGPGVDLETHITDVVNVLEYADLRDVILVGHSYAGVVVTGAVDRTPERISQLVYVESGPVPDGLAYREMLEEGARDLIDRQLAEFGDGWRLPMPEWEEFATWGASLEGLGDKERRLMRGRATPQPRGTFTQPLRLEGAAEEGLAKVLISCSFPLEAVHSAIAAGHPWFKALGGPEWSLLELSTGHWPMFSEPARLAELLLTVP